MLRIEFDIRKGVRVTISTKRVKSQPSYVEPVSITGWYRMLSVLLLNTLSLSRRRGTRCIRFAALFNRLNGKSGPKITWTRRYLHIHAFFTNSLHFCIPFHDYDDDGWQTTHNFETDNMTKLNSRVMNTIGMHSVPCNNLTIILY